jgi:hypothetical protein
MHHQGSPSKTRRKEAEGLKQKAEGVWRKVYGRRKRRKAYVIYFTLHFSHFTSHISTLHQFTAARHYSSTTATSRLPVENRLSLFSTGFFRFLFFRKKRNREKQQMEGGRKQKAKGRYRV